MLLCRSVQVPTPEQVAEALCQAGYSASVVAERGSLITKLEVELKYAPDKMPITIQFYSERCENPQYQMGYEEWKWWQEILPDMMERKDVRRFISIYAQEDVNADALQAVVDYVTDQADAVTAVKNILSDTLL